MIKHITKYAPIFTLMLVLLLTAGCLGWGSSGTVMYDLDITVEGNGEVLPSSGRFKQGVVDITVIPGSDSSFKEWSGTGELPALVDENQWQIKMDGNRTLVAVFELDSVGGESPTITSIQSVDDLEVSYGLSEAEAIALLPGNTTITDSNGDNHIVVLDWSIEGYQATTVAEYIATGVFDLPEQVNQADPALELKVTAIVSVKADININAIVGVEEPASGQVPVSEIAQTDQYTGTVTWSPADNTFAADTEYTATITLVAKDGFTFAGIPANFFTVAGATATNDAKSGVIKAEFFEPKILTQISLTGLIADNKEYDGTLNAEISAYGSLVGVIGSDDVVLETGSAVAHFESADAQTDETVTVTGLTLSGAQASNYKIGTQTTTADITAKQLIVSAKPQTKVQGDTIDPMFTYTVSGSLVEGDEITGELSREADESVGTYEILQGSLSAGSNYNINYVGAHFMVTALPIDLGLAGNYVILSKTGITTTTGSAITGDMGVSPIAATAIAGFDLIMDASGEFSSSALVTGKIYAATYAPPTPTNLSTAIDNMGTAYTEAAGRAPSHVVDLHGGDLSGETLTHGVYVWNTEVLIDGDVFLDGEGNENAVWIFQISNGISQASGTQIILTNGAKTENIFWQVADTVTIGTDAHFEGTILAKTDIDPLTRASINGRLLAQTAVTLDENVVVAP